MYEQARAPTEGLNFVHAGALFWRCIVEMSINSVHFTVKKP